MTAPDRVSSLYHHHYQQVFRFVRRFLPRADAEDLTHDVFVGLLRLDRVEDRELSSSYLLKTAHNLIKRRWRSSRNRMRPISIIPDSPSDAAEWSYPYLDPEAEEARDLLTRQVHDLPAPESAVIRLIVCGGMHYAQAARALGVRTTTVNNWRHRAVHTLKRRLHSLE